MSEQDPEAIVARGNQHYHAGLYQEAEQAFSQASQVYEKQGNPLKAAEAANNRAVALLQLDQAEAAIESLSGTPEIFLEAGAQQLAAQAHGNFGQALAEASRPVEAKEHYQRAIELFQKLGDQENLQYTAKALSQLELSQGDAVSALFSMQRGLEQSQSKSWRDRLLRWLLRLPSRFLSK